MLSNIVLFGTSIDLYKACYVLGFLTIFVFNFFYAKKFNIKPIKGTILTIVSFLLIYLWAFILSWVESLFSDWGHHNAVRVYIWMPLLLFSLSKLFKEDWKKIVDYMAPAACIVYAIARLGCIFAGCCYGYEWPWGIYSQEADRICFPVQLCESLTAFILAAMCIILNRKKEYVCDSRTYFIMLIPYGLSRFIWEFFADNDKVIWNISSLAIHALLMTVVGAVMLIVLHFSDKKKAAKENSQKESLS